MFAIKYYITIYMIHVTDVYDSVQCAQDQMFFDRAGRVCMGKIQQHLPDKAGVRYTVTCFFYRK